MIFVVFVLGGSIGFFVGIFAGVSFAHSDEKERQARINRLHREGTKQ